MAKDHGSSVKDDKQVEHGIGNVFRVETRLGRDRAVGLQDAGGQ